MSEECLHVELYSRGQRVHAERDTEVKHGVTTYYKQIRKNSEESGCKTKDCLESCGSKGS